MGRTLPTFRLLLDQLEAEWGAYARALSGSERERFARLWQRARRHASASSYQGAVDPFHAVFISVLLEHEAELEALKARPCRCAHDGSLAPGPPPR